MSEARKHSYDYATFYGTRDVDHTRRTLYYIATKNNARKMRSQEATIY